MGGAKIVPDSFMPRRLATVIRPMKNRHSDHAVLGQPGKAEVIAATPADTDTATVST